MQKPRLKLEMRDQRQNNPTLRLFAKFSLAEVLELTRKWVGESWLKPWRRWSWLGGYDEGKNSLAKGFNFVNMSTSFWTLNSDSALGFESILLASAGISATAAMEIKVTNPTKTLTNLQHFSPKDDIFRPEMEEKHKESMRFPTSSYSPERKRRKKRKKERKKCRIYRSKNMISYFLDYYLRKLEMNKNSFNQCSEIANKTMKKKMQRRIRV